MVLSGIKNWLNSPIEREGSTQDLFSLGELQLGFLVTFAPEIAGTTVSRLPYKVTGINSYRFGDEQFISYALTGFGDEMLSLILVLDEQQGERGSYFALSRPLMEEQVRLAVGDTKFKLFLSGTFPHTLSAHGNAIPGWVTASPYTRALSNESGTFLEGGSPYASTVSRELMAQPFDYALYADDDRCHAVEIEQYTDGRTRFFATLYLPLDYITTVSGEFPPLTGGRPKPNGKAVAAQSTPPQNGYEIIKHEYVASDHAAPASQSPADTGNALLELDAELAKRLIEEAMRNEISLANLVRRIADLPRHWKDSVLIPIELEDADYAALAKKYDLFPQDKIGIHTKLREELALFAGYEPGRSSE